MSWYDGALLDMAKELGHRILPAFNTTTGIPYPKVGQCQMILLRCSHYVQPVLFFVDVCRVAAGRLIYVTACDLTWRGRAMRRTRARRVLAACCSSSLPSRGLQEIQSLRYTRLLLRYKSIERIISLCFYADNFSSIKCLNVSFDQQVVFSLAG